MAYSGQFQCLRRRQNPQGSTHDTGVSIIRLQEKIIVRQVKGLGQGLAYPVNFHDSAGQKHRWGNRIVLDHVGLVISEHGMNKAQENVRCFRSVLLEMDHVGFGEH